MYLIILYGKTCLRVRGETTIYPTAMGDVFFRTEIELSVIWYITCADWLSENP